MAMYAKVAEALAIYINFKEGNRRGRSNFLPLHYIMKTVDYHLTLVAQENSKPVVRRI